MAGRPQADPKSVLERVIDVSHWRPSDEFGVHPVGAKAKRTLICPDDPGHPALIANHAYLFKIGEGWKSHQIWSEALAYQMGCAVGVGVPKCFIARNAETGEVGALIEFFYGYPEEDSPRRLIHGADLLQERGFTIGGDRPHNVLTNIGLCAERGLAASGVWWGLTVCFDALIGNTDRHTGNWGLLVESGGGEEYAPRFDNGTSLAYQMADDKLVAFNGNAALDRFIDKGVGHLGWDEAHDERTPLIELCRQAATIENAGAAIRNVIQADLRDFERAIEACARLDVEPSFLPERGELVLRLIERRRARLREVCGD